MDTTFIYALNDPETGECRYVGKSDNPKKRLGTHLRDCQTENYHCANWIKALVARGLQPVLEILHEVPFVEWPIWERAWIKASLEIGMDLTNILPGGETPPDATGRKHTPEACEKIRRGKLGEKNPLFGKYGKAHTSFGRKHSPETLKKISAANSGENGAWFGKVGPNAGRKFSKETREKMSKSHTGLKFTAEHCTNIGAARKKKKQA